MGKILEADQLTIGFRRHATSKSRSKWRISRNPDKPSRKNQLKPARFKRAWRTRGIRSFGDAFEADGSWNDQCSGSSIVND